MFHAYDRKTKSPHSKPLKDLTAIVSPEHLLAEPKRKELVQKLLENSAFEPTRFESLCGHLIHHFIHYAQTLPETSNSYYSQSAGLVDHALNRTEAAISLFKDYVLQDNQAELSEEQALWLYVLFSAGILQGVGKLHMDYHVDLYDANGQLLKRWSPLLESMSAAGSYYHFEFLPEGDDDFRRRLNILMARQLMPASGFSWIASNPEVLAVWLALLSEDARSAGTLGAILIRADAIAIQRYYSDALIKGIGTRTGRPNRLGTFVDAVPESLAEKEFLVGVEFIKWLTQKIQSGQIQMNKPPLFMVPGGMLMSVESFKWFVREHPEYKNWQAVQAGFLSLGLHKLGAHGDVISRFEQGQNHHMQSGILVTEYAVVLPDQVNVHELKTGETVLMSATELVHRTETGVDHALHHLSAAGLWAVAEAPQAMIKAGHHQRG